MIEKLYEFIEKENIKIEYVKDLEDDFNVKGIYAECDNKHVILLDYDIEKNRKVHEFVLAEECGHYATSYGNTLTNNGSFENEINIRKQEKKAKEWACEFILPEERFNTSINTCNSIFEIAKENNLSVKTVEKRFRYLQLKNGPLYDTGKFIVDLTRLPNLVKYERSEIDNE